MVAQIDVEAGVIPALDEHLGKRQRIVASCFAIELFDKRKPAKLALVAVVDAVVITVGHAEAIAGDRITTVMPATTICGDGIAVRHGLPASLSAIQ